MEIRIATIPACEIAYIRQTGPYGAGNIQTMEKIKSWAKSNHLLDNESVILGITHDNPETTKPGDCRYDACLVIAEDCYLHDDTVCRGRISEGKYAFFIIDHTAEAIRKAWSEIFQELNKQGSQIDYTKPIMERYSSQMVKNHKCEICVPIY